MTPATRSRGAVTLPSSWKGRDISNVSLKNSSSLLDLHTVTAPDVVIRDSTLETLQQQDVATKRSRPLHKERQASQQISRAADLSSRYIQEKPIYNTRVHQYRRKE